MTGPSKTRPFPVGLFVPVILAALGVASCLGVVYLTKRTARQVEAERPAAEASGRQFGLNRTSDDCLTEVFRRGVACDDSQVCEFSAGDFFKGCLHASQQSAGFCDDVPSPNVFATDDSWFVRRWTAHGKPHHGGIVAEQAIRDFCDSSTWDAGGR